MTAIGVLSDCIYDILLTPHGPACSCPDWEFRRNGRDEGGCKHVKSLRAVGLLSREAT
jgi:predicted nucleic acid-binding Zn finger protein